VTAAIALPRLMRVGPGACREIPSILSSFGFERPLIVSDRFLADNGHLDRLVGSLADAGISARVFVDTVPDPTTASIVAGVEFLRSANHDCVIGFGGGSPLDSAKAIAVLSQFGGRMRDYRLPHVQDAPGLPLIAIPTTAGTGSEATRFTIITEESTNEKMLCVGLAYLPIAAVVDFELTLSMPRRLTADTGIDSLTHAIEAYVSKKANPFSDAMALQAMKALAPNLRLVDREPENREAREAMMLGATLAGIAFSNASVALVHGMSRPVGALFHVPHGLSNAMLLPAVTAFSAAAALPRYAECAIAMGVAKQEASEEEAVAHLLEELRSLNADLQVPTPAAYGISRETWESALATMTEQALASGSPSNNPRVPTPEEIKDLYREAYA
jgi:alcohol dehydrogenase class IV